MKPWREFLSLEVPGLAEGRPSVLVGDKIILSSPEVKTHNFEYDGFVHEVSQMFQLYGKLKTVSKLQFDILTFTYLVLKGTEKKKLNVKSCKFKNIAYLMNK